MLENEFTSARLLMEKKHLCKLNEIQHANDISLRNIRERIKNGNFKLELIKNINWKDFEEFCSDILKRNGYKCMNNLRFRLKNKKRHEIDIIAISAIKKILFSIDVKHWKNGGRARIINAIKNQALRTSNLFLKCEKIFNHKINLEKYKNFRKIPLLITLNKEDIIFHNGNPIVSLEKLNDFLQKLDEYLEIMPHF